MSTTMEVITVRKAHQGAEVLHFAVTVGVVGVGRPIGDAYGQKRDGGRHQVQRGMGSLGQDAKAACCQTDYQLDRGQKYRGYDGLCGGGSLLLAGRDGLGGLGTFDSSVTDGGDLQLVGPPSGGRPRSACWVGLARHEPAPAPIAAGSPADQALCGSKRREQTSPANPARTYSGATRPGGHPAAW
jgi:hypothetical protein